MMVWAEEDEIAGTVVESDRHVFNVRNFAVVHVAADRACHMRFLPDVVANLLRNVGTSALRRSWPRLVQKFTKCVQFVLVEHLLTADGRDRELPRTVGLRALSHERFEQLDTDSQCDCGFDLAQERHCSVSLWFTTVAD